MKINLRLIGMLLLFFLFSVGFQYTPTRPVYPVNIYSIDSLLLVADAKLGVFVYSVAGNDTAQLVQTILRSGARGMAMRDSTMYIGTWDGIFVYHRNSSGSFDSVYAAYRSNCCSGVITDSYYSRSILGCNCNQPVYSGGGSEALNSSGIGGSYAIFALIDTFLYVVDGQYLVTFSIAKSDTLDRLSFIDINWNIETLYSIENTLYIGGTNGMYIVDRSDGANPKLAGSVAHFRACDPVVVHNSVAWVTLRSGNFCGMSNDELWTVSVKDPANPKLLHTTPAPTPYGLAVRDSLLYVANGYKGYSLYRVDGEAKPVLLKNWETPSTKDFIWSGNRMFVMAFDRVHIMNVSDPTAPRVVFTIE